MSCVLGFSFSENFGSFRRAAGRNIEGRYEVDLGQTSALNFR